MRNFVFRLGRIHLHNTGDIATSCIVKAGGRKQITGVSGNGDATVSFELGWPTTMATPSPAASRSDADLFHSCMNQVPI